MTALPVAKKKKVAVLIKLVPNKLGSMEDWLTRFVEQLSRNYVVAVATHAPCHHVVLERLGACGASWHDLADVERSVAAARTWLKRHAEIAHFSLFAPRSLSVVAAAFVPQTAVVFQDCYSTPSAATKQSVISRLLDRITFLHASQVIGVSRFVAHRLHQRFGLPTSKLRVVYNGVDVQRFRQAAAPSECEYTVCVAALIADKGVDILLRAFAHPSLRNRQLLVCGDGPERAALERLSSDLGLDGRVRFLGLRDDVHEQLAQAAVVVHPAVWGEAFGLTIAEAMASGRPVVGCDVGAIPELIEHGVTGLLIPPGDAEALASAIAQLLEDPEARDRMGSRARERVEERFSLNDWVSTHATIIDETAALLP